MTDYIADWDGRLIHRPARPKRNPRLVIDTHKDHVEAVAFAHGSLIEADATHMQTTHAGITYRAELIEVAA